MMARNILYLHTHDMGRFNSLYGHAAATPNMERLARSGTLFQNAFCASPTCSPSRAALLTGQAAHSAGMLGLANMGFCIGKPEHHLSRYLRGQGFSTALFGVQHEAPDVSLLGYDTVYVPQGDFESQDAQATAAACDFLRHVGEKRFFVSVGLLYPHRPFKTEIGGMEPDRLLLPEGLPDTPETRRDYAEYLASVQAADRCVGGVLDALEQTGLAKDTVVVLTTDHGIAFPRMKCTLYDAGMGVTLAIRAPGKPEGLVARGLVSHIDVFPTLCGLMDVPVPQWVQGVSLLPMLDDPGAGVRDAVYGEINYHVSYAPQRSVRTGRYLYLKRYYSPGHTIRPNIDGGPSKDVWLKAHGTHAFEQAEELYDLLLDPTEHLNCLNNAVYGAVLAEMRALLEGWMRETGDPLLDGDIPLPKGAFCIPATSRNADGT